MSAIKWPDEGRSLIEREGELRLVRYCAHCGPETLYPEEIDVLVAIIGRIVKEKWSYLGPTALNPHGTFLLAGQKDRDDEAVGILSFDFEGGEEFCWGGTSPSIPYRCRSSRNLVDCAVSILLPDYCNRETMVVYSNEDDYMTPCLSLKTTHGRFLCAACAPECFGKEIYVVVATALALMGKEDKVLRDSSRKIFWEQAMRDPNGVALFAERRTTELFDECELPELKAWRDWHGPANDAGELKLFFED